MKKIIMSRAFKMRKVGSKKEKLNEMEGGRALQQPPCSVQSDRKSPASLGQFPPLCSFEGASSSVQKIVYQLASTTT